MSPSALAMTTAEQQAFAAYLQAQANYAASYNTMQQKTAVLQTAEAGLGNAQQQAAKIVADAQTVVGSAQADYEVAKKQALADAALIHPAWQAVIDAHTPPPATTPSSAQLT